MKRRFDFKKIVAIFAASELDFGVTNNTDRNYSVGLQMIPNICPSNN